MNPALYSSARHDWGTPQGLFDLLHQRHQLGLDVAANRRNRKLPHWLGPDHPQEAFRDALAIGWEGRRCWMNPPYGRDIGRWLTKAVEECQLGALVVCLVPARTDTAWWHESVMAHACRVELVRGRLIFEGAEQGAPFPSAVVTFSPEMGGPPRFDSLEVPR